MGLLDDAIREHLDLKRRSGADAAEVSKLEHEAFGPLERDEALAVPPPAAQEAASRPEPVPAPEPDLVAEPVLEPGPVPEPEWIPEPEPASVPAPDAEPATAVEGETERWATEAEATADAPIAPPQDATVEFSALDAVEPDPQPDGEPGEHDELEETPEFLQEAPEHDRLWFEQKPPRDFDF